MMFRAAGAKKFFGRKPPTGKVDTAKSSKYVVFFIPYSSQLSLNRHLYSKNWWITPYKNGHQEWHWQNPANVCFVDQLWFVKPVLNSPPLLSSQLAIPKGYCRSTNSLLFTSMTETKELQKKNPHKSACYQIRSWAWDLQFTNAMCCLPTTLPLLSLKVIH